MDPRRFAQLGVVTALLAACTATAPTGDGAPTGSPAGTPTKTKTPHAWDALFVAMAADGKTVGMYRFSLPSGEPERVADAETRYPWYVSADGSMVASTTTTSRPHDTVVIASAGDLGRPLRQHVAPETVTSAVWLPDGATLYFVTAPIGEPIPAGAKEILHRMTAADGKVAQVETYPSEAADYLYRTLVGANATTTFLMSEIREGFGGMRDLIARDNDDGDTLEFDISTDHRLRSEVALTPDGSAIVVANGRLLEEITLDSAATRTTLYRAPANRFVETVHVSPDGTEIVFGVAGLDARRSVVHSKRATIHRLRRGEAKAALLRTETNGEENLRAIAWSPDGRYLWLANDRFPSTATVFDLEGGAATPVPLPEGAVNASFAGWLARST